jgi:glycosyltransferase involved in cell wall biosynthesis
MKKKIVFVIPGLDAGGGEKSLVNLLNTIDSRYEIDVVLFHKRGIFLKMIPENINVYGVAGNFDIFSMGLSQSVKMALKSFNLKLVANRILFALKNRWVKNVSHAEQFSWKYVAASMQPIEKQYDVAIAFLEKSSIYFTVEKINATKKIGFIHNDYIELGMAADFDRPYFKKLNHIVTVSGECAHVLEKIFPEFQDKISVMYNIVSPKLIHRMAKTGNANDMAETAKTIVSIGRLHPQKGFDMAIDACEIIVKKGHDIKWYVIGEGHERPVLEKKIADKMLENHFFLIGLRENPYPYVKKAALYAQTSRFEGKSIAIDEAKILAKPIVVTNFTTVKDQIQDKINGVITEINPESVAKGIIKMLEDETLRQALVENLKKENLGTEPEIEKLYDLIETR